MPAANTTVRVNVAVNGAPTEHEVEARTLLVQYLREVVGLTGTNIGCDSTSCGACTVLLDGEPIRACLMLAVQADGRSVTTIEGVAPGDGLHPVQEAFWAKHGLQCGYCTPGIIMSTCAFLREQPAPSREEIREMLAGHLCRCTGYHFIVEAIEAAAQALAPPIPRPTPRTE
jgi:aerobic carbon-monoxide dehydrogenase small subunit